MFLVLKIANARISRHVAACQNRVREYWTHRELKWRILNFGPWMLFPHYRAMTNDTYLSCQTLHPDGNGPKTTNLRDLWGSWDSRSWGSRIWRSRIPIYGFRIWICRYLHCLQSGGLESASPEFGSLETGGLESQSTDFGSGFVHNCIA